MGGTVTLSITKVIFHLYWRLKGIFQVHYTQAAAVLSHMKVLGMLPVNIGLVA